MKTLKLLDLVETREDVNDIPRGSIGTIVHCYENSDAVEVEFRYIKDSKVELFDLNQLKFINNGKGGE